MTERDGKVKELEVEVLTATQKLAAGAECPWMSEQQLNWIDARYAWISDFRKGGVLSSGVEAAKGVQFGGSLLIRGSSVFYSIVEVVEWLWF